MCNQILLDKGAMPFFKYVKAKKRKKRYAKLTHKAKIFFFKRVFCDHWEIKQSAEALKINYSTAKTLMRKHHRFGYKMNLEVLEGIYRWYLEYDKADKVRCSYKLIEADEQKVKVEDGQSQSKIKVQESEDIIRVNHSGQAPLKQLSDSRFPKIEIFQQVLFHK